jgi:hypothetical protein
MARRLLEWNEIIEFIEDNVGYHSRKVFGRAQRPILKFDAPAPNWQFHAVETKAK